MGKETVSVSAGGNQCGAFEEITIEAAIDHAVRSFSMTVAAAAGLSSTAWVFKPGAAITVNLGDDLAFTGYTDRYQPSANEHKGSSIGVAARSRSQDFVDGSAMHETGRFENQTILEIAKALDTFGIGFATDQDLEQIEEYQVTPGETAFSAVNRLAHKQGLVLSGQADGSILITKAGSVRHAGGLFHPGNIKSASADLNWSHRHSKIIVRGQKPDGDGAGALQIEATAEDGAVGRNRPLLLIEDGDIDQETAQERADTRRDREAGESLKASATVQGFRDDAGKLWTPGYLVWTESAFLGITQLMLIRHVSWRQSRKGGSTSELTLVDPRAFGGKSGKGGSAEDAWSIEDSD